MEAAVRCAFEDSPGEGMTADAKLLADKIENDGLSRFFPEELRLMVKALRAYRGDEAPQLARINVAATCAISGCQYVNCFEWVPVTQRMPKPYQSVLIGKADILAEIPPITAFWTGEKWTRDVMGPDNFSVTHWAELPKQPVFKETDISS